MEFRMATNKGEAESLGNLIRKIALKSSVSYKPIAFTLGSGTHLLKSDNTDIIEDMTAVGLALSSLTYNVSEEQPEIFDISIKFTGVLTSDNLNTSDMRVLERGKTIVTSVGAEEVTLTMIMYQSSGIRYTADNREVLNRSPFSGKNLNILTSRHSDLVEVVVTDKVRFNSEELSLKVVSKTGSEKRELHRVADELEKYATELRNSIDKLF